jgi:hypothetical protein
VSGYTAFIDRQSALMFCHSSCLILCLETVSLGLDHLSVSRHWRCQIPRCRRESAICNNPATLLASRKPPEKSVTFQFTFTAMIEETLEDTNKTVDKIRFFGQNPSLSERGGAALWGSLCALSFRSFRYSGGSHTIPGVLLGVFKPRAPETNR